MIVRTARYVVSRTTAGGIAVRALADAGGHLLGYTVPTRDFWVACIRPDGEFGPATPWPTSQQRTADDAEKVLRAELGMPDRPTELCPWCAEDPESSDCCHGNHPDAYAALAAYYATPEIGYVGGLR